MLRTQRLTLSVIVPTLRFDLNARQMLTTVAMAGSAEVQVLIGDNSVDPDKWDFLRNLESTCANVHVFCHSENIGEYGNQCFLLEKATNDLVCLVADDDVLATDYLTATAAILAAETDAVAASGLLIAVTPTADGSPANLIRAVQRTENTALERIQHYHGLNLAAYAVARRESILRMSRYVADTPLRTSFMDYIRTYSLLAEGKFRVDDSRPVYLYVNTKWSDEATAWQTSAGYYVACGLPESFQHFHSIAWAVACLHFFLSSYRPSSLDAVEAEQIAILLYERWITDFRAKHDRDTALHRDTLAGSTAALLALHEFIAVTHATPARRFSQFLLILAAFSPALAERYCSFLKASLISPDHCPGAPADRPPGTEAAEPRHDDSEMASEVERLTARVRALESSTSWRLTAPLRRVASMLSARRR